MSNSRSKKRTYSIDRAKRIVLYYARPIFSADVRRWISKESTDGHLDYRLREMLSWLSGFKSYDDYMKGRPSAGASVAWKEVAHRLAVSMWDVPDAVAYRDAKEIR